MRGLFGRLRPDRRARRRAAAAAVALALTALASVLAGGASSGVAQTTLGSADLILKKSDSPDPVTVNGALTYTIGVSNAGPDAATNATMTDTLPSKVDFVSATPSQGKACKHKGHKVTCNLGTVDAQPGTVSDVSPAATVTIRVTAPKKPGTITNSATVLSDIPDPKPANNSDSESTRVVRGAAGPSCAGHSATIVGTGGPDLLIGTAKADVVVARRGNDTIATLGGHDIVCAGGGADLIKGGAQGDLLLGQRGADRIAGNRGADVLRGGRGTDRLKGGAGADLLLGGPGNDSCSGGPGADTLRSC